ncbi:MAG: hypothetical protein MUC83_01930 [Pirellula sp.]|jgi:hypothetical protein|nr:hypothetical protein [Pirellula sp.]
MAGDIRSQSQEGDIPFEDIRSFEAWVAAARDYVVPTDDLRPRVLENASGVSNSKLQERRIGYAIISVAMVSFCWGGIWLWLTSVSANAVSESSNSISRRALELHDKESINIHQATVDAYEEWRSRSQRSLASFTNASRNEVVQPILTPGSMLAPPLRQSLDSSR